MIVSSRRRWVVATTLLVALELSSTFQVVPRVWTPMKARVKGHSTHPEATSQDLAWNTFVPTRNHRQDTKFWATQDDDNSNESGEQTNNAESYQGLYEFLTRRNGEQSGETERRRKRDRILDWMGSSAGSNSGGGSNLVRPIRVEDGSIVEEDPPPRTKARFDRLFSGMPTINEILSRDGTTPRKANVQESSTYSSERMDVGQKTRRTADDSWFEEEKRKVKADYEQIIREVREQISQQRKEQPDSMPENAEGVAESIVRQEMDRMLKSLKLSRAKERLQEYESDKISELNARDISKVKDEVVEQMLREAAEQWKRNEAQKVEIEEFMRYESEARRNLPEYDIPLPDMDMDTWALRRLEDMLASTQKKASESGAAVTDILEEQIDALREQIEKESKKGSIKPQTMKEWQMYRAIATRLGQQKGFDPDLDASLNLSQTDEDQVAQRLESWKEYVGKEEEIRKRAGLSVGTKMPFDWQTADKNSNEEQTRDQESDSRPQKMSRREVRREVNIQALRAFEALIQKSEPSRAESLKKQLESLKAELEARDYVDIEEEQINDEKVEPVDLSDVFGTRNKNDDIVKLPSRLYEEEREAIDRVLASDAESIFQEYPDDFVDFSPPLDTASSSSSYEGGKRPPPPKTPFFDEAYTADIETVDVTNTKLGSADDQKLLNMYRRAGARTKEEQDSIRKQWEEFQALEKSRRDESGLSDQDDSTLIDKASLKYDLSEVLTSDGDFDAEKILSTIGPRPARKKKVANPNSDDDTKYKSELDPTQVSESLFRSVAAVGGGRFKDDVEARELEKANFEEYLKKEEEMRRSLDSLDENAKKLAQEADIRIDDPSYAQDVLASIGPRPVFKKARKEVIDEKVLSDRGGVAYAEDDDEEDLDDDNSDDSDDVPSKMDFVPDWLKKEREAMKKKTGYESSTGFAGRNIDEIFDDDKYDHNLRQLHEYEQRRSGRQKQMGIDISDVLGSRARGSDDYADYSYDTDYFRGREDGWGAASFEARKANLLDYVELSTSELNNLMDHRASVYATGVSQYLPRINKPFKEFGAIFRLEGVLVDLTGIHYEVWKKVAAEFQFKQPILDDVRRAAVLRPDVAVREIFYWTNDVFMGRGVASCFQRIFREVFHAWASSNGLAREWTDKKPEKGSMAIGADSLPDSKSTQRSSARPSLTRQESEQSKLKRYQEAWITTAKELELSLPTNEQIAQSTFLSPDIAVRDVFRWTSDRQDIDAVVAVFSAILNGDAGTYPLGSSEDDISGSRKENPLLESQYQAWTKLAKENSFEVPSPEEVIAAAVLNDPEIVIMKGFGWTEQVPEARKLADTYRMYLAEFFHGQLPTYVVPAAPPKPAEPVQQVTKAVDLTDEQMLLMQITAWSETAAKHGFTAPKPDQIQLALNLSASDAVRRLLGWTYNFNETQIGAITQTYAEALKKNSAKHIKQSDREIKTVPAKPAHPEVKRKELTQDELYQAAFAAWTNVAWESGFSLPDQEQVQFAMSVGPEDAIVVGFQWTTSYQEAQEIAKKYRAQIQTKRAEWVKKGYFLSPSAAGREQNEAELALVSVVPGVREWIKSLHDVEMACGVTSYLHDDQVGILLEYAGLADLLPSDKRVSLSNGYNRDSQQILGVALRIERRPDHCVLFDSSPSASAAAHEVDMRSVAIVGSYPRYELLTADTTASSFDELTAMNIRRLFGERVYDQPMLEMVEKQPQVIRKTKTTFWDDE